MKMKKTAALLAAVALGAFAAHAAAAEVRYTKDYSTVEEAFKAMQDGDTLVLTENREAESEIDLSANKFHKTDADGDGNAEMTIDLNGNILTLPDFSMRFNHIVNITDTKSGGTLAFTDVGFLSMNGGILNINSGIVSGAVISEPKKHSGSEYFSYINVNGGQIIGDDSEYGYGAIAAYYETVLNVKAGNIAGKITIATIPDTYLVSPNEVSVTGGTFTDKDFVDTFADSSLIRDLGNGSYAVGKYITADVITENVAQETIADTAATGFVTTISSEEAFDLTSIKWDVTYDGETRSTDEYNISGITLNGDAKIGLAVGGFADANATASATVNGYIK